MVINPKIYIFLIFFIFIGLSCDEAIELPSPDTTPPIASFMYPFDGDVVEGNYSIKVRAVDNEGVYKVDCIKCRTRLERFRNAFWTRSERAQRTRAPARALARARA